MTQVAILRPDPGASSTEALLTRQNLEPVKVPLFEVKPTEWKAPDPKGFDGLLVTSSNAFRFAGDELKKLKDLPVYAVGPVTAQYAKKMGFKIARMGNAGVAKFLKEIPHDLKLIHLIAEDRLEYRLVWQTVEPITIYKSEKVEKFDAKALNGTVTMVHSPRAGKRLAEIADDKSSISVVAISKQAAAACGDGWKTVVHSEDPDDRQMVALAAKLCDNSAKG